MAPWGHFSVSGTSGDKNYSPKGLFLEGNSTIIGTNACNYGDILLYRGHPGTKISPQRDYLGSCMLGNIHLITCLERVRSVPCAERKVY